MAGNRLPIVGIGKPERLKYGAQGMCLRRMPMKYRLVYLVAGEDLVIIQACYH